MARESEVTLQWVKDNPMVAYLRILTLEGSQVISPRTLFVQLLREIPGDTIVYHTMSGTFTAEQMSTALEGGAQEARAWISDLMRVFRDMLAQQAQDNDRHQ